MESPKGIARHIGVFVTETAISGAPTIPMVVFVSSFLSHEGDFVYVLPFVLFYAFLKVGNFTLGLIGEVTGVYRILRVSAVGAAVGSLLMMFDSTSIVFFDIGAIVLGFSLSVFCPFYKTYKKILTERHQFPYPHADTIGLLFMICCFLGVFIVMPTRQDLALGIYGAMNVTMAFTICFLLPKGAHMELPMFDTSKRSWKNGIPALLLFALAFLVRNFKQTASGGGVMVVLIAACAILVIAFVLTGVKERTVSDYLSVFLSENVIFASLFCVFMFVSEGIGSHAMLIFVVMFATQLVIGLIGDNIQETFREYDLPKLCVIGTALADFLLITHQTVFLGLVLANAFTGIGKAALMRRSKKPQVRVKEAGLRSQQVGNLGILMGQTILVCVMAAVSWVMLHSSSAAMASYALHIPESYLAGVFTVTGLICAVIMCAQAASCVVLEKRRSLSDPL